MRRMHCYLAALLFAAAFQGLNAKVLRVCESCPVRSITEALRLAAPADTIEVDGGLYKEGRIDIFKPVRILGINHPVIDGEEKGHVIYVEAPDVTIEGLLIENSGTSDLEEFAGIYVEHSERCRIIGNHLKKNTYGVYLSNSNHCIIQDNTISGAHDQEMTAGNGVHLFYAENIEVLNNEVSLHRDGRHRIREKHANGNRRARQSALWHAFHVLSPTTRSKRIYSRTIRPACAIMYSRGLKVRENLFEKSLGF